MNVASNGCRFHVRMDGPETAPVVMLSHGVATDLSIWDPLVPILSQRHRVLRYDSRGHGQSEATKGDYSLAQLADDVVGIMDALDLETVHFAGLSMGGMVGLELARRAPARMASIAVCDARGSAPAAYREAWRERSRQARASGMEALVDSSMTRWFTPHFLATQPEAAEHMRRVIRSTSVDGYCGSAAALAELDHESGLDKVTVPLLFLTGAQDQGAPPEAVRAMHAQAPGSTYVEIPDAGHISVMEQPQAFAQALERFIATSRRA